MVIKEAKRAIEFPIEEAPFSVHKLRKSGLNGASIVATFPKVVIWHIARGKGLTLEQFIDQYRAVCYYGGGDSILFRFEKAEANNRTEE